MPRKSNINEDWFACPGCGAELPNGATFCRECGASEDSGWGNEWEDESSAGYGDDDDFEYDEFLRREFPQHAPRDSRQFWKRLMLVLVVVLVCLALLAMLFY